MKKYIVLLAVIVLAMQLAFAGDEPTKCTLNVKGMDCGGCVSRVKNAVSKLEGVASVDVNLEKGIAEVSYLPDKVSPNDLIASIEKTGFGATLAEPAQGGEKKYPIDITKEMGMPKGNKVELLAEFKSNVAGYERVQVIRHTIQPGVKIENFKIPYNMYCNLEKGRLFAKTPDGKEMTLKAGDRWVDHKGLVYPLLENRGKTPCVDAMFWLIEAETGK